MMQSYGSLAAVPVSATGKNREEPEIQDVRIVVCGDEYDEWNRRLDSFLEFSDFFASVEG